MRVFKKLRNKRGIWIEQRKLNRKVRLSKGNIKVIIGSGRDQYEGWISTNLPYFDATNERHWRKIFGIEKIDNLLAEHVLEHLSETDVKRVLQNSFRYLKKAGVFRIAVPDQFHLNHEYIEHVKPNGTGPGADDHKSFWNHQSITRLAEEVGFEVNLIEYWDEAKKFHGSDFDESNGIITRSKSKGLEGKIQDYSSLIVDLIK